MKNFKYAALALLLWTGTASAEDYTIKITAVKGTETYNYTHKAPEGEQTNYVGKVKGKPGRTRQIILNALAAKRFGGGIKLQYMFELDDPADSANPPLELVSEVALATGVKTLAARGAGWKLFITASGPASGDIPKGEDANYLLKADLAAGGKRFPLTIAVIPGAQLTQLVIQDYGSKQYKYTFSALPGKPAFAGGELSLQYSFTVKADGRKTAEGSGEARIKPGEKNGTTVKGAGWKLSLGIEKP
jgi:hypothetical protein